MGRNSTVSLDVAASPDRVWTAIVATITDELLKDHSLAEADPGGLRLGMTVRVGRPGPTQTTLTVTALEPGRAVTVRSSARGFRSNMSWRADPSDPGTRLTVALRLSGPIGWLLGLSALGRRSQSREALRIKAAAEAATG